MFALRYTNGALEDLRLLKKNEQVLILAKIEGPLAANPMLETRHCKPLRPNDLSEWELRINQFRVFYDVDRENGIILIKAVGWKEHNKLFIRGREFEL